MCLSRSVMIVENHHGEHHTAGHHHHDAVEVCTWATQETGYNDDHTRPGRVHHDHAQARVGQHSI